MGVMLLSIHWDSKNIDNRSVLASEGNTTTPSVGEADGNLFIPVIANRYPVIPSTFGVEVTSISDSAGFDKAVAAQTYWVRNFVIDWSRIEPDEPPIGGSPTYQWQYVDETGLLYAAAKGAKVIAMVKFTPVWARMYPQYACGPVADLHLDEFARFMGDVVNRYSRPPYNVKYWEIGNEPDVDPIQYSLPEYNIYGCWGDHNDPYYGGGYYAEALKLVYPAIKQADPHAQVLIGGLLLDCDPLDPDSIPTTGPDCRPASKFFEGILRHNNQLDGANYFDIVSFHGYPPFVGFIQDDSFPKWNQRGGVVLGKVAFLREVLSRYNVSKPIIHTEGSLICPEYMNGQQGSYNCNPPNSIFFEAQADYVVWLYVRNIAEGLMGTVWYMFNDPGWRYSGMLDLSLNPRPSYNAYKFMTEELVGATFVRKNTSYPGVKVFEFSRPGKRIWVMWTSDGVTRTINLPGGVLTVYNKYGATVTPSGNQLPVNSPYYVELTP
jgi:hypothetical protein